jgi:hypothetical protein
VLLRTRTDRTSALSPLVRRLWGDLLTGNNRLGVCQARLDVIASEIGMGGEQLGDIRIMGELFEHQVHGNARPLDDWLTSQNAWVRDDSLLVDSLIFFHMQSLYRSEAMSAGAKPQIACVS